MGAPCLPISLGFPRQACTIESLVWNALCLSLGVLELSAPGSSLVKISLVFWETCSKSIPVATWAQNNHLPLFKIQFVETIFSMIIQLITQIISFMRAGTMVDLLSVKFSFSTVPGTYSATELKCFE